MQISAEVFSGNSGGPVIAFDGTVIGMVQRKVTATRTSDRPAELVNSISLALDSSALVQFLSDTPAQASLQDVALDKVLRPYQIYQQSLASILTVVGLTTTRTGQSGISIPSAPSSASTDP
jgi:S1-C subfamily serine protease